MAIFLNHLAAIPPPPNPAPPFGCQMVFSFGHSLESSKHFPNPHKISVTLAKPHFGG
jgi:hypothetical protein